MILSAEFFSKQAAQYKSNEQFYSCYRKGRNASDSWHMCWQIAKNLACEDNRFAFGRDWIKRNQDQLKKYEQQAQAESDALQIPEGHG